MDTEVRVHTTFNCMLINKKKKKEEEEEEEEEWTRGMRLSAEKIPKRNLCNIKLASG